MTTPERDRFDRRSVLKMSGTALALTAGLTGTVQAAPDSPKDVTVSDYSDVQVELRIEEPDSGHPDHYEIDVYEYECGAYGCYTTDLVQTVHFSSGHGWVEDLRTSQRYKFYVYSADEDGNRSDSYASVKQTTDSKDRVIHAADSWDQSTNALGGDWAANHFLNGTPEITDDGLYLDYDADNGIFWTDIDDPDGSGYLTVENWEQKAIAMVIRGDEGGEGGDAELTWDADETETKRYDYATPYATVDTSRTVLKTPLDYDSYYQNWEVQTPGTWKLEFHKGQQNDGGLTIESMWISNYPTK